MSASPDLPTPAPFKDRRTGLILFGILELLMGGLCLLLVPLMFFGQTMQARVTGAPPQYRMILPAVGVYGALAAVFVIVGIGSILARRWARALSLILSWSWLAVGLVTMVFEAVFLPRILATAAGPNQNLPPVAQHVMLVVTLAVLAVMFVAVPASLVLFYRSPHVRLTCEARDPVARWTDACPLPVLGMSVWLGLGALSMLMMGLGYGGVLPCFGVLISGWPGMVICGGLAGVWAYLAWAGYRLQPHAWWLTVGVLVLFAASAFVTFSRVDLMEMYRLMGYPEQQIEVMRRFSFLSGPAFAAWSLAGTVPMLGYLLWVKRFFRPAQ
jgi:hypothetical protein